MTERMYAMVRTQLFAGATLIFVALVVIAFVSPAAFAMSPDRDAAQRVALGDGVVLYANGDGTLDDGRVKAPGVALNIGSARGYNGFGAGFDAVPSYDPSGISRSEDPVGIGRLQLKF